MSSPILLARTFSVLFNRKRHSDVLNQFLIFQYFTTKYTIYFNSMLWTAVVGLRLIIMITLSVHGCFPATLMGNS